MGTFGSEFVNVRNPFALPVVPAFPVGGEDDPGWEQFTRDLIRAINGDRAAGIRSLRDLGGYLYFPPGNYFLTSGFAVWPLMTVIFAPNAVLTMPRIAENTIGAFSDASVILSGSIEAGLHQFVNATTTNGAPNGRGGILFQTDTVKEVYPEWWGAQPMDVRNAARREFDSTDGIQSAINAAVHNIQYGATIPVVLSGRYQISKPIQIGSGSNASLLGAESYLKPFVLRGRGSPGLRGPASLEIHEDYPALSPNRGSAWAEDQGMLIVRGPPGFLIEDVLFQASRTELGGFYPRHNPVTNRTEQGFTFVTRGKAFSCLRLEVRQRPFRDEHGNVILTGDAQMSRVRRCGFVGAAGVLVQIGEFRNPYGAPPGITLPPNADLQGAQDLLGLVFESCKFSQETGVPVQQSLLDQSRALWFEDAELFNWLRDGVYYRANNTLRLHFIDCFWRGIMRTGVRAYGGSITFTNCNAHITRMPVASSVCASQDNRYITIGSDSELPAVAASIQRLDGHEVFTDARDNGCDIYVEWFGTQPTTGITVFGFESQSHRFLSSYPATKASQRGGGVAGLDVYFEDAHLLNAATDQGLVPLHDDDASRILFDPPAVEWLAPFSRGASITFSGLLTNHAPHAYGRAPRNDAEVQSRTHTGHLYRNWLSGRVIVGVPGMSPARLINLGARTAAGYSNRTTDSLVTAVFFTLAGIGLEPTRVTNQPWFLDLVVPATLVAG